MPPITTTPTTRRAPPPSPALLDAAEHEYVRRLLLAGNPFPMVAYQWPEFLVTDPDEARYFDGTIDDPDNPCLRLDNWQRDIIACVFDGVHTQAFIKGNTKAGKGTSAGIVTNLWFDVFDQCKVILTSQRYDHAIAVIFGEVVMWRERMTYPRSGRLLTQGIADGPQHYVTIANPATGEGFSGQHGPKTLFVMDESTAIPDGRFEDAQKQAAFILALANPRTLSGWFKAAFTPCPDQNVTSSIDTPSGRRRCYTIDGAECCNVRHRRLEKPVAPHGGITIGDRHYQHNERIPDPDYALVKPLIPNQVDYARYVAICQHADPRHVAVFAHGHFPDEDPEKQVILSSWLARHVEFWRANHDGREIPVEAFGFDIARSLDGDATCLVAGGLRGVRAIHTWHYADTNYHAEMACRIASESYGIVLSEGRHPVVVDMDGLGAGTGDILRAKGVWVIEFHGGGGSQVDPRRYGNARAEAYGTLGRRLDPNDQWGKELFAIPDDPELHEELTAPEKVFGSDPFRFHITPKVNPTNAYDGETIKGKLGRSPDKADGVVYLFHGVRELHNLNQWMAQYSRALIAYPAAPPKPQPTDPAEIKRLQEAEELARRDPTAHLLNHLRQKYGRAS
jgi:hypothetical protein